MRVTVKLTFCLQEERTVQSSRPGKRLSQSGGREDGTLPEVVAVEMQPLQLHVGVAAEERHVSSSPLNHYKRGRKEEDTRFILRCFTVTAVKSRISTLYLLKDLSPLQGGGGSRRGIRTFSPQEFKQNTFPLLQKKGGEEIPTSN